MRKENLTENKAEATPTGGVLVGKREGQTMIHNKGSLSGYLVGRTHAEGGIKAVNKSTGQPLEMQGGEVVITAPAVSDTTKREFEGKMLTNREILSEINKRGGGVSFADGGEMPKSIKHTGASYKYGGKTMTDHEIMMQMNGGGHLLKVPLRIINKVKKLSNRILEIEKMNLGNDVYSYDGDLSFKERAKLISEQDKLQSELTEVTDELSQEQCYSIDSESFRALNTAGDYGYEEEEEYKSGGHLAESFSLRDITDIHQVPLAELKKQVRLGMEAESEHTSSKREQMKIVKDHLFENPEYYTLLKKAGLKKGGSLDNISDLTKKDLQLYDRVSNVRESNHNENNRYHTYLGLSVYTTSENRNNIFIENVDKVFHNEKDVHNYIENNEIENSKIPLWIGTEKRYYELYPEKKGIYKKGGEVKQNLPKIGSKVDARWNNTNRWTTGTFKGETKNGFEVYNFTIETPNHIEYYAEITEDSDNRDSKIFKSKNFKDRNYKNYNFEKMANGGKTESLVKDAKSGNSPSRDLNNYNDLLDVEVDGAVGGYSGIYADGGAIDNEYEYVLTVRPFDIGTYPKDNFLRFTQQNYQYGVVTYSKPLPIKEMEHYSLCPITEIKDFDGKILDYKIGNLNLKARVKLEFDKRRGYFVNLFISDDKGIMKTQPMSGVKFLEEIKNGRLALENEIKDEPKKDNLGSKKEKSFESEGSKQGKGKLYEFFTPQIVADKMLALAQHYGFKGGNVLEPATGSGRLIKNLKDANITAFEISKDNFKILEREFPNAELHNFNFEKAFLKEPRFNTLLNRKGTETWLKNAPFDLVVANPPYGKFSGLYSSYFSFKGQVEHFFILQSLHLLKKGGLGVYLIPSSFMRNGIAYNEIKKQIFEIAELVDAYRLPSNIFEKTQIGTDILILRKK
jgi:hypothetical protein